MTNPNVRPDLTELTALLTSLDLRPGDEWYAYIHKGGYDLCVDSAPRQPDHSNPDRIVGRFACGGYAIKCLPIVARVMNDAPDLIAHIERLEEVVAGFVGALTDYGRNRDNVLSIDHDGLCARIKQARATLSQGTSHE